jgi:plasmid stabilization system protein ParE
VKPGLRFAARALADIEGIGNYMAAGRNPTRSRSFTRGLRTRCARVVDHPGAAALRPEYGAGVRAVPFGRFLVLHLVEASGAVLVSRVVRAAQRPGPVV